MEKVFSTANLPREKRYDAWRSAICDHYVHVDVKAAKPDEYKGFINESRFGAVVLTDIFLSGQTIRRNAGHISQLDKDCYYLQLVKSGALTVVQRGDEIMSNPARGAIFCATEQYELHCAGDVRSLYLELPRADFARRFPKDRIPVAAVIDTAQGLGRIATEFCAMLAAESGKIPGDTRAPLGEELMNMLALSLLSADTEASLGEGSIRRARLRSVTRWIEEHIGEVDLSPDRIAAENGMSVRNLHRIFQDQDRSVSEWMWDRRLQLAYDEISKAQGRRITTIAYEHGFNSSAHFSTMFRRKYGMSPRDVAKG